MKNLSLKELLESYEKCQEVITSSGMTYIIPLKDSISMSLYGGYGTSNTSCNNYNCDGGSNSGCTNNCCYNTGDTGCQPG